MAETTEFIGGMEKIIAFIKSQGERVKKLEDENKNLKQTCLRWQEKADFNLDMSCDECGLTTTEDDLQISLKHGSLICEGCYDEKEEEYQPKGSRIDPEGLHDYMKEQNKQTTKMTSYDEAQEAIKNLCANWFEDEKRNYGECYETEDEDDIATTDLKAHNYKDLRIIIDWFKKDDELKEENKELKEKITCLESDSHNEVSQAEYDDMKEQYEEKLRMSRLYEFFRMCEGENGFHKNTNLYEKEWLSEMYDMINDRRDSNMPEIDELFDEYKEWIGYEPEEEEEQK